MIRQIQTFKRGVLIVALVISTGVTAAYAQTIFVRPEQKGGAPPAAGENVKPKLYLAPKGSVYGKPTDEQVQASKIDPEIKLENRYLQKVVAEKIQMYKDMNAQKFKPKTSEEILAYADASRARQQAQNYKRRERLYALLEKQQLRREQRKAAQVKAQSQSAMQVSTTKAAAPDQDKAAPQVSAPAPDAAPKAAAKAPRKTIYQKPDSFTKPSKVFSDY